MKALISLPLKLIPLLIKFHRLVEQTPSVPDMVSSAGQSHHKHFPHRLRGFQTLFMGGHEEDRATE